MTIKTVSIIAVIVAVCIATFGTNPLSTPIDSSALTSQGYTAFETGVKRQPNGVFHVRALTRMPGVKPDMVKWWFADYMRTTDHYKRWHPIAHVWMDWENKVPGEYVGASHLVHEYIGEELAKLRIQFVEPQEILGESELGGGDVAVCARVGLLEKPINVAKMCHIVRETDFGAEMRSWFWMGYVAKREQNTQVRSVEGLLGNTYLARKIAIREQMATDLMIHAVQEMGILADFLPELYRQETGPSALKNDSSTN